MPTPRRCTCAGRRGGTYRPPRCRELSCRREDHCSGKGDGRRGDPSGLWLPVGERWVRAGRDRCRADLGRSQALQHRGDGPEGCRQEADARGGRSGDAGLRGRGPVGRAPQVRSGRHRLSSADQGRRGRRRKGDAQGRCCGGFRRHWKAAGAGESQLFQRRSTAGKVDPHPAMSIKVPAMPKAMSSCSNAIAR